MTLSKENRVENMGEALRLLLDRLGDRAIYMGLVLDDDPAFTAVYPTTWKDLADRHLVKAHPGIKWCRYELTGYGWLTALKLAGELDTRDFQQRFGRLNATLKGFIDGRHDEAFEQVHVIAAKATVSEDWLYNILESRIWEEELNRRGAQFDDSKTMVIVPIDFNMPLL